MKREVLSERAWVELHASFLEPDVATALLAELLVSVPWERRAISMFGREVVQPRLVAWAGALPYRYSGRTLEPRPMGGTLRALTDAVNSITGAGFDHVLLNRYRDGRDHMGWHADDEPELGPDPPVAGLSLGVARVFELRPRAGGAVRRLELGHGSLLVMGGSCQHDHKHRLPPALRVTGERVNLTFRRILRPPGGRR